jgi:hypothetical protein
MKHFILIASVVAVLASCETSNNNNSNPTPDISAEVQKQLDNEKMMAKTLDDWKNDIKNNPDWLAKVVEGAKEKNISVDSNLTVAAIYSYNQVHTTDPYKSPAEIKKENEKRLAEKAKTVDEWKVSIKNNKDWYEQVVKGAKEKGISVEENLKVAAEFAYSEAQKK